MNKLKLTEQILYVISAAENSFRPYNEIYFEKNRVRLKKNIDSIRKAFSGSWLGYHASIYYKNFNQPNAGDYFSPEWGLMNVSSNQTSLNWKEKTFDSVKDAIMEGIDPEYEQYVEKKSRDARIVFDNIHDKMIALVSVLVEANTTPMLEEVRKEVSDIEGLNTIEGLISIMRPKGPKTSRDSTAISQGYRTPPHIAIEAWHKSHLYPFEGLLKIIRTANKLINYMEMQNLIEYKKTANDSKVFIGHGHAMLWREFKDFIEQRLKLDWDEYNRESAAGIPTQERLQTILNQSCFAFLIMTAEDQHVDGSVHARENIIHEVGLFQGKLGFRRAIILLEEGCSEFSNIAGLGQIRFSKGKISSAFEDVRKVLEREGILKE